MKNWTKNIPIECQWPSIQCLAEWGREGVLDTKVKHHFHEYMIVFNKNDPVFYYTRKNMTKYRTRIIPICVEMIIIIQPAKQYNWTISLDLYQLLLYRNENPIRSIQKTNTKKTMKGSSMSNNGTNTRQCRVNEWQWMRACIHD